MNDYDHILYNIFERFHPKGTVIQFCNA